ncbi:unnamed protein product [Paramecium octaurelia]|uniref:Uncharacterized protein n=1 Tax=Paramecium octaurelia TaxID=43137 RepID=A0A8S1X8U3_PAROT|nr:unnamed protein product [Paramecium octaurelia]
MTQNIQEFYCRTLKKKAKKVLEQIEGKDIIEARNKKVNKYDGETVKQQAVDINFRAFQINFELQEEFLND